MKKLIALFAAIILVSGFTTISAQVTGTATGSATVITPIAIVNAGNMNFGNIAVSPTLPGTVLLTAGGVRSATGGVTLPAVAGTISVASFTVSGLASSTYSITLPTTDYPITFSTGTMIVNGFTSTPTTTGALSVGGSQTITVGATLNVGAAQLAGLYTNAAGFIVKVNYN